MSTKPRHRLPPVLLALGVVAIAAPPARAQVPTEVRLCLQDQALLAQSGEKQAALDKLRSCAREYPDVFQLQKTLGKKLAELADESGDEALTREAIAAWENAVELDAGQFASLFGELAALYQRVGQSEGALRAWERSLEFLTVDEARAAEDQLWVLYRKVRDDEKALELWPRISYRHADDHASQAAAARLLEGAGRLDEAKRCWQRALELRPEDAGTRNAYHALLARTAATGGAAEKSALLDAWLPKLGEADDEFLRRLLGVTGEVLRPDAARAVAEELLRRQPGDAAASVVLAESAHSEGDETAAQHHAMTALAGELDAESRGRCHALLGRIIEAEAYAHYQQAPQKTGREVIDRTAREYERALAHYRQAAAAGLDMAREIANVTKATRAIGGQVQDIQAAEVEAAERACTKLSSDARYAYDRDKPLQRRAKRGIDLARSAGGSADEGNSVSSGAEVALMDSAWSEGSCWLKVKTPDGRQGWASEDGFSS